MRVAILTTGRYHVCDLARELDALGHEVDFYSIVPRWRTRRFGLPDRCNRWYLPWVLPQVAAFYAARGTRAEPLASEALLRAVDRILPLILRRCDVLIGMSGMSAATAEVARRKYGARILIERGSRHILSQREILEAIRPPGARQPVSDAAVRREQADYAVADTIVVPSWHVLRSFTERGVPEERLFRNPYGVDLAMFPPTPAPAGPPTIVNTGMWSLQKGSDVLAAAWRGLPGTRLLHVGEVGDAPLPREAGFEHHDAVDQRELTTWYGRGHVFALASRQEGFGMVLAQALASGLRVVCTDRTGGEDLRELLHEPDVVSVAPAGEAEALQRALGSALAAEDAPGPRDRLGAARQALSWRAYGERYDRALRERR